MKQNLLIQPIAVTAAQSGEYPVSHLPAEMNRPLGYCFRSADARLLFFHARRAMSFCKTDPAAMGTQQRQGPQPSTRQPE